MEKLPQRFGDGGANRNRGNVTKSVGKRDKKFGEETSKNKQAEKKETPIRRGNPLVIPLTSYKDSEKSLCAEVLEVNVHRKVEVDNLLSCYVGFQTMGDEYDCPILFWENGWLICSCRRDGGVKEVEKDVRTDPYEFPFPRKKIRKVKRDAYYFLFPVLCACPYENYTKTIPVPTKPEMNIPLVRPGSKFIRDTFKQAVEDAVKHMEGEG